LTASFVWQKGLTFPLAYIMIRWLPMICYVSEENMKNKEASLYEPVRSYLEEQGYEAVVVSGTRSMVLATGLGLDVRLKNRALKL